MAFGRIRIRFRARDTEEMADDLRRLAHVEFGDRIGEAALEPDDRLKEARPHLERGGDPGAETLGAGETGKPAHALLRPDQRRVAERFGAARQDQIGIALADIAEA